MGDLPDQLEALFSLKEAAARFLPAGFTAKALRTEAKRGRLRLTRIAGKDCVTQSDILEMVKLCRDAPKPRASCSDNVAGVSPYMSSSIEERKRAQAAARETLKALKPSSGRTSPASTRSPAKLVRLRCSTSPTS